MNENCYLCECFTELYIYLFYCAVCFQSFSEYRLQEYSKCRALNHEIKNKHYKIFIMLELNSIAAVATDTRLWMVFICLFKPEFSWTSINCFNGFPLALTEKVPSSLNEGRIISNDDGFLNYFIKMKDYIVKTTRSLRAEWNSRNILYSLRDGFQVVYLFDVWKHGSRGRLNC